MAAKKNNPGREERLAKNNRNLNRALGLFTAGFVAEFYLLVINNFFVKGTVDQLVAASGFLEVMSWVGAAMVGAGVVFTVMRGKWKRFAGAGLWLLAAGVFFALSSRLMLKIYPEGTTAMCILVPVLMLLSVVYLLYEHEFAVQATALAAAIAAAAALNHGSANLSGLLRAASVAVLVLIVAALIAVLALKKQGGVYRGRTLLSSKANYTLTGAVLALCAVAVALAMFVPGMAYYVIWVGSAALFALF